MEKAEFKNLLGIFRENLKNNKKNFDTALKEDMSKGNYWNFKKISKIIDEYEIIDRTMDEKKSIAVSYLGNPEITVTYILDAILYNNKVTLCINEHKKLNSLVIKILVDSLKTLKMKNQWINYSENYNEIYLKDNEKFFHKVVFIGDYYEYQQFKNFFKKDVVYNNYGYMKIFMDKNKFAKDYKKMTEFALKENISLEVYDDPDDFVSESREEDNSIIFGELQEINKIKKGLKAGQLQFNNFPYDSYKFEIIK